MSENGSESTDQANSISDYYNVERLEMLSYVPDEATSFLEIGCGAGAFGAELRRRIPGASVTGIEMHAASASIAKSRLNKVYEMSIESAMDYLGENQIDCVICNDVLEHLVDPWKVLEQLRAKLTDNGVVVASIPNVRYFPVFKDYLLHANWEYKNDGVLDRTHLRFFTRKSIVRLFEDSGFVVQRIDGIFSSPFTWKMKILNAAMGYRLWDMKYERFACQATTRKG